MPDKIKVLFIVRDFVQAGTQRFTYEVDRALNKEVFTVTILSIIDLKSEKGWNDYYYEKHIALGTEIFFLSTFKPVFTKPSLKRRILHFTHKIPLPSIDPLIDFVGQFDAISLLGEYIYPFLKYRLAEDIYKKSLIHIMCAKFQYPDIYKDYDKNWPFNFVSGFDEESIKYELSEFTRCHHFYFPLSFRIETDKPLWKYSERENKRIGIITRLDKAKPLYPFIFAFHLLLDKLPELELHIVGTGDPEKEGINHYIRSLHVQDRVFFRGHTENVFATVAEERFDMIWYQGSGNQPGGFLGYDMAMIGIPQVLWNFDEVEVKANNVYVQHRKITSFVAQTLNVLTVRTEAEHLSKIQMEDCFTNRDINRFIGGLENEYKQLAANKNIKYEEIEI